MFKFEFKKKQYFHVYNKYGCDWQTKIKLCTFYKLNFAKTEKNNNSKVLKVCVFLGYLYVSVLILCD